MKYEATDSTLILTPEEPLIAAYEDQHSGQWRGLIHGQTNWSAVTLDLCLVKEVDSRGINLVVDLYRSCRQRGSAFAVKGATDHVKRVFDLLKLESLFPVESAGNAAVRPAGN